MIQMLNRITLIGYVGNARVNTIGGTKVARFTVATTDRYKSKDGETVLSTNWSECTAFESPDVTTLERLQKGTPVKLEGRLRQTRYTDSSGAEHYGHEVLVRSLEIIEGEKRLEYEEH